MYRDSNWMVDSFEESEIMSTYLVAFAVTQFEKIETRSPKYNVFVQVYARPDAIKNNEGDHALKEAAKIIDYFSDYFNTTYPLKQSSNIYLLLYHNL